MARGDTGRWVARAAATGGGRSYRGQMPLKWYSSLALVCLLGVTLIVYSRYERLHPAAAVQPAVGSHWYAGLAFDVCGKLQANLPVYPSATSKVATPGIHTQGDGVIYVEPTTAANAGNNATLARFVELYPRLTLTSSTLGLPGKQKYQNGEKCGAGTPDAGKVAQLEMKVWPSSIGSGADNPTVYTDPAAIKLGDGQLITVAFVPSGASVPKPSATVITTLLQLQANSAGTSTTTPATTAVPPAPTTTAPASGTTTTAATTTTKPTTATTAATTTTKPTTTTTKPKT